LLAEAGIGVTSCTVSVGAAAAPEVPDAAFDELLALDDAAPMRTLDEASCQAMIEAVEAARTARDSVGGVFEVLVRGVPPGLGSHVHWDRKLDGRLAGAVMSVHAVKAVSIGEGVESSARHGSETHDPIAYEPGERRFRRSSNRAGGIEGGISNGEMIRVRGYLKPLATLPRPLASADLVTKEAFEATRERTDTIPIVAAGVVAEAMACLVIADELLIKFGGDRLDETVRNLAGYRAALQRY
jgi:chorismate synthase